jgi:hypothetical protein
MVRMSVVLPAPLAPTIATMAPFRHFQRHAVERADVAVGDFEVFDGEHYTASTPR